VYKVLSDVVIFYCRSWAIYRWRCWRKCFFERSWCYMQVTLRVMTTGIYTSLASPKVLRDEHFRLLCCPQFVGTGATLWLAGRSRLLVIGWRSWL